jgi:outer membrane protein
MKRFVCALVFLSNSTLATAEQSAIPLMPLDLDRCLDIAFENNRNRAVSEQAVAVAEAQHRQALSAYWPQISAQSALTRRDDDPLFIFPKETSSYAINLGEQNLETTVTIQEKEIKLLDKNVLVASADLLYPLYTGGLRGAMRDQAAAGISAAMQVSRRTDLQLVRDVKRIYYGAQLARQLAAIGHEALARLEVTLELTENLYKHGSGRVKKTDYLQNKVVVESLRVLVARLESNLEISKAALTNTLGLAWDTQILLREEELPYLPTTVEVRLRIEEAFHLNPDWKRLAAGLDAAAAKLAEADAGRRPKIALLGNLKYIGNSHDAGIVGPEDVKSWQVGIGMEVPLFDGYLTKNRIAEARARFRKLEQQRILLRGGLALRINYINLQIRRTQNQEYSAAAAMQAAVDNRRLNERAYRDDLVEVEDVIQAQIVESFTKAQHLKVLYDHLEARADLDLVVGNQIYRLVGVGSVGDQRADPEL